MKLQMDSVQLRAKLGRARKCETNLWLTSKADLLQCIFNHDYLWKER